jgi:hypothetical protein
MSFFLSPHKSSHNSSPSKIKDDLVLDLDFLFRISGVNKRNRVCVAGALRLYYSIITDKSPDTPWEGFYLWTWESIEINLGIVCASAPCLKSLITRLVPKLFSSHPSSDFPSFSMAGGHPRDERGDMFGAGRMDIGKGFTMTTIRAGRSGRIGGGRSESQDDLTDGLGYGHDRVLVAKVDVHNMA